MYYIMFLLLPVFVSDSFVAGYGLIWLIAVFTCRYLLLLLMLFCPCIVARWDTVKCAPGS